VCWHGYLSISHHTGLAKSTITDAKEYLQEIGVLTWKKGVANQYAKRPNLYQLNLARLQELAAAADADWEQEQISADADSHSADADSPSADADSPSADAAQRCRTAHNRTAQSITAHLVELADLPNIRTEQETTNMLTCADTLADSTSAHLPADADHAHQQKPAPTPPAHESEAEPLQRDLAELNARAKKAEAALGRARQRGVGEDTENALRFELLSFGRPRVMLEHAIERARTMEQAVSQ
jgi:hypothetical protein